MGGPLLGPGSDGGCEPLADPAPLLMFVLRLDLLSVLKAAVGGPYALYIHGNNDTAGTGSSGDDQPATGTCRASSSRPWCCPRSTSLCAGSPRRPSRPTRWVSRSWCAEFGRGQAVGDGGPDRAQRVGRRRRGLDGGLHGGPYVGIDAAQVGDHEVFFRREVPVERRPRARGLGEDPLDPDRPDALAVEQPAVPTTGECTNRASGRPRLPGSTWNRFLHGTRTGAERSATRSFPRCAGIAAPIAGGR